MDPREEIMALLAASDAQLERLEDRTAKDVADAYERARRDLLAELLAAYDVLGDDITPGRVRTLINQGAAVRAINQRLAQLRLEFAGIIRAGIEGTIQETFDFVWQELEILAAAAGVPAAVFLIDDILELSIVPAIEQVENITRVLASQLVAEFRAGIARGDRFSDLSRVMLAKARPAAGAASIFRRGVVSAELFTRRAMVQANNNSHQIMLERAGEQIPKLKKQAVAAIKPNTTDCCLAVHGQIVPLDGKFKLTRDPRFNRRMAHPPFHWNCRTRVVGYLVQFEKTSSVTTADMEAAAKKQMNDNRRN